MSPNESKSVCIYLYIYFEYVTSSIDSGLVITNQVNFGIVSLVSISYRDL